MTLLNDYSVLVLVGFPLVMIGIQVFLFVAPGEAGEAGHHPENEG